MNLVPVLVNDVRGGGRDGSVVNGYSQPMF